MLIDYIENYNCLASFNIKFLSSKLICEKGHKVSFVFPSNDSRGAKKIDSTVKNLSIIATPGLAPKKYRTGGFGLLDTFYKSWLVLRGDYDVIHTTCGHRPAQLIPALIGKYLKQAVIIDEWWAWYGKGGYSELRKGFIGKCIALYDAFFELSTKSLFNRVISITHVLKKRLKENKHVVVMHGGAETNALVDYEISFARSKVGLPENYFLIGMSNLCEDDYDDNLLFLEAFKNLSTQFKHLRLFVTGDSAYISKFLSECPFKDQVLYKGWLSFKEYNYYLSACNVFVLPLRNIPRNAGRWPNKILDYFALSRPVLTNPVGDLTRLFGKHSLGYLCEENSNAFLNQVEKLINDSSELEKPLDSRSLAAQMSFDKRINSIIKLYQQAVLEK